MFEHKTFNNILNSALERVPDNFDKRQGSIIYDALAPLCAEMAQIYIDLDRVLKEGFAQSASKEYLLKRALERGLEPYKATYSIILADLKGDISLNGGERFNLEDVNFYYTGEKENDYYKLKCEEKGIKGNISYGELLPIDNIEGLETAVVRGIFYIANDDEDVEEFRKRYLETFKDKAFGGNRADYILKLKNLNKIDKVSLNGGIGGVKVYRATKGGGNLEIFITNYSYKRPTAELLRVVKEIMNPEDGEGIGIAPIGHILEFSGVVSQSISISTNIELKPDANLQEFKKYAEDAIDNYFLDLAKTWEDEQNLVIRVSHIESILLDVKGVQDIKNTTINGQERNITLNPYSIPLRGTFNVS